MMKNLAILAFVCAGLSGCVSEEDLEPGDMQTKADADQTGKSLYGCKERPSNRSLCMCGASSAPITCEYWRSTGSEGGREVLTNCEQACNLYNANEREFLIGAGSTATDASEPAEPVTAEPEDE